MDTSPPEEDDVDFALDPLETLRSDLKITVRAAEHLALMRDDGGACDGVSYLDDGVVLYAPSQWSKRQNFTLAHELGHWRSTARHTQ